MECQQQAVVAMVECQQQVLEQLLPWWVWWCVVALAVVASYALGRRHERCAKVGCRRDVLVQAQTTHLAGNQTRFTPVGNYNGDVFVGTTY